MKHHHILLLLIALLFSAFLKAQDTIVFRSGEKLLGKVTKVTGRDVEYKRADNPDGPVYNATLDKVSMVIYQNGNKDVFAAPRVTDSPSHHYRDRGRRARPEESPQKKRVKGIVMTTIGTTFLAGGAAVLIYGILEYEFPALGAGAALIAGGIPLTTIGSIKIHRANKALNKHKLPNFDSDLGFNPILGTSLSPTGSIGLRAGVGMSIRF